MSSSAPVARRLRAAAVELERVPTAALIAAAKLTKDVARAELVRAGRPRVRVWSRRRRSRRTVRLRAVDTLKVEATGANLRVQGVPVGPWVWANEGTGAHLVGAGTTKATGRTTAQRVRRDVRYLSGRGYGHPVRGPLYHPGARGASVWRRVVARSEPLIVDAFADAVREAVR